MRDGGRLSAAIDVLSEIETRRRPVQEALKDWGNAHRFAGSGDRVAIGNLVFDALRHKLSYAYIMGDASPRALALATYVIGWQNPVEQLVAAIEADPHAPAPLSDFEFNKLASPDLTNAEDHEVCDIPKWLYSRFQAAFGEETVAVGRALSARAPIDMRVNTLKADPERVLKRLAHLHAVPSGLSPAGIRLAPVTGPRKSPHVQAEEGFRKGWFELQDEASQIAALMVGAKPGDQVLDLCAGGGGKSLALAANMDNKGQIYAFDASKLRLAPLYERMARAGVRNIQVVDPQTGKLDDLKGRMDKVLVDAPCSGTGVWRRRPDTKWRVTENALAGRVDEQRKVLAQAAEFVKPGGVLTYATCSLLPEENQDQVRWFLEQHPEFAPMDLRLEWARLFGNTSRHPLFAQDGSYATLTPAHTDTDGFFLSLLQKQG